MTKVDIVITLDDGKKISFRKIIPTKGSKGYLKYELRRPPT